ncbi:MAG: sensor histidine kinase [Mycobacteriales bacterium]
MAGDPILSVELREEIVSSFEHRLRAQGSPILVSAHSHQQMLDQARSILDDVIHSCRGATESIHPSPTSQRIKIDTSHPVEAMHPADSLHVASVLFETALPFVQRAFSGSGQPDAEVALMLHRAVMSWVASSAVSHTMLAIKAIRDAHRAELARLARDLHDRAAHAIGVAIQNLELYEVHAGRDVARAQEKLHRAREAMRLALDSVRHSSSELRTTVRPEELAQVLKEYLAANADSNVLTSVEVTGDTAILPREMCVEVYFTLREAIRNALVHSGTTRLDVTVGINRSQLHARVSDTGRGFVVEEATHNGKGLGLTSMRERMQLLGGELRLSSLSGHGTTAEIVIPLGGVLR